MNHRIFKYTLKETDQQKLDLPIGAKLLSVQAQNEAICIWALVNAAQTETSPWEFFVYGTGHPMYGEIDGAAFLGTVQLQRGTLVFHVFAKAL
jgi:uncharacterized phage-associated protein